MIEVKGTKTGWFYVTGISVESGTVRYARVRADGVGFYIMNKGKRIDVSDRQDRFIREENIIKNFWQELVIDNKVRPEYLRKEFKL